MSPAQCKLKRKRSFSESAYPDDDAQRLIFADWLDEEGDPRAGRFIRVQLAARNLHRTTSRCCGNFQAEEQSLLAGPPQRSGRPSASADWRPRGWCFTAASWTRSTWTRSSSSRADQIFDASPVRHIHLLEVNESIPAVLQSPYLSRLAALSIHGQHSGEPLARAVSRSEYLCGVEAAHTDP